MKRLLLTAPILLVVLAVSGLFRRHAMHFAHIAPSDEQVLEWQGYSYLQHTDTRFSIEGTVSSVSPNGGAFCSGPFQGGPGISFTLREGEGLRNKGAEHSFTAFGDEKTEPLLKALHTGARVRLVGTEGAVRITKAGQVMQTIDPVGDRKSVV